jgi:predicted aldo/keto reductase-like oxidoreductase
MEKVRLGRTNLTVTRLGWGGIPIQRVTGEEAVSVVRSVVEMGVDLLDTARGYTTSEERIGKALAGMDRRVVISTKSPLRTADIYNDVRISLERLGVKKIDIYNCHGVSNPADYEKVMGPGGAYEGLLRARDEKLIDFLGLTSHSLDMLERVIAEGHFDTIMTCYSFIESEAEDRIFPKAREKDIGVLAMKSLSGGVIEKAGPALRYVLQQPGVALIPGSESVEKAAENWAVFTGDRTITAADRAYIEEIRQEFNQAFCRRCDYCQPCTEGIPIQMVLGVKSFLKRLPRESIEGGWIKDLVEKGRNCSECGECLPRCPYQLPIPDLIKENLALWDNRPDR